MTTYYDFLRERVLASPVHDRAQLERLIDSERNTFWQQIVANPAYDERGRMASLAAFDEAAAYLLSEQSPRLGSPMSTDPIAISRANPHLADSEPVRGRSLLRDVLFFLLGAAVGFGVAYVAGGLLQRDVLSAKPPPVELGVVELTASQKSFKFTKSLPSSLEGELAVKYASGTPSETYVCEVEATYRQILEYARFDKGCKTVSFKFLPLSDLLANFNYLEGYIVFSAIVMSPEGAKWQGSASVYFSIDGTT